MLYIWNFVINPRDNYRHWQYLEDFFFLFFHSVPHSAWSQALSIEYANVYLLMLIMITEISIVFGFYFHHPE